MSAPVPGSDSPLGRAARRSRDAAGVASPVGLGDPVPVPGDPSEQDPPRGPLSPEVVIAARTIDREVWGEPYRPGQGPMHHAGGPFWRSELLRRAAHWERMAEAARVCAEVLPDA